MTCTLQTLRIGPTYNTLLVSKTERNMFSHASHITLSSTYRCSYQAWERYSLLMMAFLRFYQRVWSHRKYRNCRLKNVHTIKHRNESGYAQGNVKFYNLQTTLISQTASWYYRILLTNKYCVFVAKHCGSIKEFVGF